MRFYNENVVYKKGFNIVEDQEVIEVATYKGVSSKLFIYLLFLLLGVGLSFYLINTNPGLLVVMLGDIGSESHYFIHFIGTLMLILYLC